MAAAHAENRRNARSGLINGLIGIIIFSGSLPATRMAISGFSPLFLTAARGAIAGLCALALLRWLQARRPVRDDLWPLVLVSLGVVVGFPLFTALALQHISAARSVVFTGLLPLATALFGVLRTGDAPRPLFWLFALAGSACVAAFALSQDAAQSLYGDLLMLAAIIVCGYGYAEGARLSRHLGGWQVICWALALALPAMLALTLITWPPTLPAASQTAAWAGLAYVSLFSMLIGFVFWYRGLAQGGVASVSQLQLLQPLMGLGLAAALLGEPIGWPMLAATVGVILCVAGARRFAWQSKPHTR